MSHSKPRLLVVGSSNTDLVIQCNRLPKPGETLLGGAFTRCAGGKGANQAVAAARAGARVTFVGVHGADDLGRAAKAGLRSEGIDVRYFRERRWVASGVALILIDTLTPNEHEAKTVGAGARRTVVTQGARGVRIGSLLIPAPKVKPVDTVGAGDCFTAWLAVGLAEGLPLEEAARRAVRAASISVTRSGAQASMPYRQEVCELIRGCRREVD